jgi:hypothetical protein
MCILPILEVASNCFHSVRNRFTLTTCCVSGVSCYYTVAVATCHKPSIGLSGWEFSAINICICPSLSPFGQWEPHCWLSVITILFHFRLSDPTHSLPSMILYNSHSQNCDVCINHSWTAFPNMFTISLTELCNGCSMTSLTYEICPK